MPNTREKLIELMFVGQVLADAMCDKQEECDKCQYSAPNACRCGFIADHLIANGVTFATDNNVGSKWIPVTERLPEADAGDVLCITPGGHYKVLQWLETFGCWSDPGGIDFTNFKRGYVTHWMPLPPAPKGE